MRFHIAGKQFAIGDPIIVRRPRMDVARVLGVRMVAGLAAVVCRLDS